jgi:hypothetical protein
LPPLHMRLRSFPAMSKWAVLCKINNTDCVLQLYGAVFRLLHYFIFVIATLITAFRHSRALSFDFRAARMPV